MDPGTVDRDAAFTEWVRSERSLLMRTAYLLCGDAHLAEDLVQTSLTRLYLAWPRVANMDWPNAYARRALINAHIDMTRRPWWSRERSVGAAPVPPPGHGQPAVEDSADRAATGSLLIAALLTLAPGQRRVVVLRHLWDLSVSQAAEELGCSTGTVKSQDSDALRRLSQMLSWPSTADNRQEES